MLDRRSNRGLSKGCGDTLSGKMKRKDALIVHLTQARLRDVGVATITRTPRRVHRCTEGRNSFGHPLLRIHIRHTSRFPSPVPLIALRGIKLRVVHTDTLPLHFTLLLGHLLASLRRTLAFSFTLLLGQPIAPLRRTLALSFTLLLGQPIAPVQIGITPNVLLKLMFGLRKPLYTPLGCTW
jgi:hypothetical protein